MADPVLEQISALEDEDWGVREDAAAALGRLKDARAVGPLTRLLRDEDRAVRQAAIGALASIGEPAVEALGHCLHDGSLQVQEAASEILAGIGDQRVFDPLVRALGSTDWIVRMHAAKALGRMKEPGAVPSLIPLLQDKVKAVREEAAGALAAIGTASIPSLVQALRHEEWLVRLHAVEALGKLRTPEAVEPLLFALFNDRDSAIREDIVRALGDIGDAGAVEFLFKVLDEPGLRPLAVEALGKIRDSRAVPVLQDIAAGKGRPEAVRTVAGCGDQWSEEMLTMGVAVRALGLIRDEATIPTLVTALQNTVTRADAAAALAGFGPTVIPSLLPLLARESDENIRYHVRETLTAVGWRPGRV
ncbi:MAG TPA: HEAT repeat domain-containing protein [Nitrospiraceae bacterium]|nr:HEAT repeat domain-containing protein [Nitrospiraceae bacterium]